MSKTFIRQESQTSDVPPPRYRNSTFRVKRFSKYDIFFCRDAGPKYKVLDESYLN